MLLYYCKSMSQVINYHTIKQLDDDLKMYNNICVEYYDKGFI